MNFRRNAILQLATSLGMYGLGILNGIVLARMLSVGDRGYYSLAVGLAGLLLVSVEFGWGPAAIYRIRRVGTPPSKMVASGLVAVTMGITLALTGSLLFEETLRGRFMADAPRWLFLIALALLPFSLVSRLLNAVARAIDEFAIQNVGRLVGGILLPASTVVVLIATDGNLMAALVTTLSITAVVTIGVSAVILRKTGFDPRIDVREIAAGYRFGIKSALANLEGQIHLKVDLFMLAALLARPEEVALFTIAAAAAQMQLMATRPIAVALLPKLAGLNPEEASRLTARVLRHIWFVVGLTLPLSAIGGAVLLPLVYGQPYAASVAPFLALTLGVLPLGTYETLMRYYTATGRQGVPICAQALGITLNLSLNFALIPEYGLLGAAAASLASYSLTAVIITVVFIRNTESALSELFLIRRSDLRFYTEQWSRLRERLGR